MKHTREEKLVVSMQERLHQAAANECERRMLLAQHKSRIKSQNNMVYTLRMYIIFDIFLVQKDIYLTQSVRQTSPLKKTAKVC